MGSEWKQVASHGSEAKEPLTLTHGAAQFAAKWRNRASHAQLYALSNECNRAAFREDVGNKWFIEVSC